ncbi:MAG: hypothetical protein DWQ49_03880 [Bacteroidetes bacterium]|nr:MAG: hypothetical protein DWQ49_03880 [Bacteroidota bacterium]
MNQIIAATFDIADQKCVTYNALEWHNFIADTREQAEDPTASLEDLFDEVYGDEFWFEANEWSQKMVYAVAFDLRSESFVVCNSDNQCEMVMEMAWASGCQEEIFWAD